MTIFKDERMAAVYTYCREQGPKSQPDKGNRVLGGVLREAYHKGFAGTAAQWPRNSMAYAAWAAGRDNRKGDQVK